MPQLTGLRYASLGPSGARLDDLTLSLTDPEGEPTDTTLWLRNGGGKSVLLNLFFSSIVPDLRTWKGLGVELEEYVQRDDQGVVAAAWTMDRSGGGLFAGRPRHVTGVFYEWTSGATAGGGTRLRRVYFAFRALPDVEELGLQGLPLYTTTGDGEQARRTQSGFRQELQRLRQEHPDAEVEWTENQTDWQDTLASLGIDPELFHYQVLMNEREGGAAELFHGFDSAAEFVDFLVELVLDRETPTEIASNLKTFQDKLRRRTQQYVPERTLVEGLVERVRPLAELHDKRREHFQSARVAGASLALLEDVLTKRRDQLKEAADEKEEARLHHRQKAEEAQDAQQEYAQRAALLKRTVRERDVSRREEQYEAAQSTLRQVQRKRRIWTLSQPLRNARKAKQRARAKRDELDRRESEHADLRAEVGEAARRLAATLKVRRREARDEARELGERAETLQQQRADVQDRQRQLTDRRGKLTERRDQLQNTLEEAREALTVLREKGILKKNESVGAALDRVVDQRENYERERTSAQEEVEEINQRREALQEEIRQRSEERAQTRERLERIEDELEEARNRRQELESDSELLGLLELADLNLRDASKTLVGRLQERARDELRRFVRLQADKAEQERALQALEEETLLPPSRDVERVHAYLENHDVFGWTGGRYLAEISADADVARAVIDRQPELLLGVVIPQKDREKVEALFDDQTVEGLEAPVPVLTTSQVMVGDEYSLDDVPLVVGPNSAAYFDQKAGAEEQARREQQFDELQDDLEASRARYRTLQKYAREVSEYFDRWPEEWWRHQEERQDEARQHLTTLKEEIDDRRNRTEKLEEQRDNLLERQDDLREKRKELAKHRDQLRDYRSQFPGAPSQLEKRLKGLEANLRSLENDLVEVEENLDELDAEIDDLQQRRSQARNRVHQRAEQLEEIGYVDYETVEPQPGDLEALRTTYRSRRDTYEERIEADALRQVADQYEEDAREARRKFREELERDSSQPPLEEEEVTAALDELEDPDRLERQREAAEQEAQKAQADVSRMRESLDQAREDLQQAHELCRNLGVGDVPRPDDVPDDRTQLRERIEPVRVTS